MEPKPAVTLMEAQSTIGELSLRFTVTGGSLFDLDRDSQQRVLRIGALVKAAGENGQPKERKERKTRTPREVRWRYSDGLQEPEAAAKE
jgi:hypothetical protein